MPEQLFRAKGDSQAARTGGTAISYMIRKAFIRLGIIVSFAAPAALGQGYPAFSFSSDNTAATTTSVKEQPRWETPAVPARMPQEMAIQSYLTRARQQMTELESYSDLTVIEAEIPSSKQRGRYELRRTFSAPKSLAFSAVQFVGDNFVKSNVIVRLLQSEVEHVQKQKGAETAIVDDNYKFKFKEAQQIDGRAVYAYEVKPRKKRVGLFKGRIYLDAASGSIRRAEGAMVKSPSFFIKKIEFVQDYADFNGFSLPVRIHSVSQTRVLGTAIVDVQHSDYQPRSLAQVQAGAGAMTSSR